MPTTLGRLDVVGHRVQQVKRTPWKYTEFPDDGSGVNSCETFVELDNGVVFQLIYTEDLDVPLPITPAHVDMESLVPFELENQCRGERILEVLISTQWGSFGLLLSDDVVLHIDTDGFAVGPNLTRLERHDADVEYLTYWGQAPLGDKGGKIRINSTSFFISSALLVSSPGRRVQGKVRPSGTMFSGTAFVPAAGA